MNDPDREKSFIETVDTLPEEPAVDTRPKGNKWIQFIRNRKYQLVAFIAVFTLTVPTLIFFFLFSASNMHDDQTYSCLVNERFRVPCGKHNISLDDCIAIHCCFDDETLDCYHYLPSKYNYRQSDDEIFRATWSASPWGTTNKPTLKLSIVEIDENRMKIVAHESSISYEKRVVLDKRYRVNRYDGTLGVEIHRSNGRMILTTGLGPLIASDGYWEWTFYLMSDVLFGLDDLLFEKNVTTKKVIYKNREDHNVIPIFMSHVDGSYHGLLVENPGPMELIILPSRLVIVRCLVGQFISLTLALGPTPRDVMVQQRSFDFNLPPQWVLGPHICRDGLTNLTLAVQEYKKFIDNKDNNINYVSDCFHENLHFMLSMLNKTDVRLKKEIRATLSVLRKRTNFFMSLAPQVLLKDDYPPYKRAKDLKLLYYNSTGGIYNGTYLQKQVVYPDFASPSISNWFVEMLNDFDFINATTGFVLKDNWPAEDSFEMEAVANFSYITKESLSAMSFTLPWNTTTPQQVIHMEVHNKYGANQVKLLNQTLDNPLVFTSAYNYGLDAIAHVQNINATWTNLAKAIRKSLSHGIFAHPLISVPVCGSTSHYNADNHKTLCMRWYITAATMPMLRISSDFPRRDPHNLGSGFARSVAVNAIKRRQMLAPYYYTTLSQGDPIARPMFFDFHSDNNTFDLDEQYMVGDALLVAQPLLRDMTVIRVYLPPEGEVWYEFFGGEAHTDLGWISLSIVESDWIMFFRQGKVVPLKNTKAAGEEDTFTLAVALNANDTLDASGSLFLGTAALRFSANCSGVEVSNIHSAHSDFGCDNANVRNHPSIIENVQVYGLDRLIVVSTFAPPINLCNTTEDTIFISYAN